MPHSHESHQFHRFGYTTIYGTCIRKSIQCKFSSRLSLSLSRTENTQTTDRQCRERVRERPNKRSKASHVYIVQFSKLSKTAQKRKKKRQLRYTLCHARKLKQLLFGSFISIPPHHQQYVDKYLHDIKCNQQQQ